MGNSYVQVYLDTTPPTATINYPRTTSMDSIEYITITSNEELSPNHEITIIDSMNIPHTYTFSLLDDKKTLIGNVAFSNFSTGIATLSVRLFDKVLNKSATFEGQINILNAEGQSLKLDISDRVRTNITLSIATQKIILQEN